MKGTLQNEYDKEREISGIWEERVVGLKHLLYISPAQKKVKGRENRGC